MIVPSPIVPSPIVPIPIVPILAILQASDFLFFPPICLAIALVTAAAHRENMREILLHGLRGWLILIVGILLFAFGISFLFEWLLPG